MGILIDTDLLVDLERNPGSDLLETLLGEETAAISVITLSELLHGVPRADGSTRRRRQAFVEHILAGFQRSRSTSWSPGFTRGFGRSVPVGEMSSAHTTSGSQPPRSRTILGSLETFATMGVSRDFAWSRTWAELS